MYIHRIYVAKSGSIKVYHSYLELIVKRTEYWQAIHETTYDRFTIFLEQVKEQERNLERLYNMPHNSLRGAHLVFGSGREMREGIASPRMREAILNGEIKFVVKIVAETRRASIFTSDAEGDLYSFRTYQLRHNFFGGAIMDDPITSCA
jgi:hypothetical protein